MEVKEIYKELFAKECEITLNYSGKLKNYNGNIRKYPFHIEIRLSNEWKTINKEIKKGIIQYLLLKIYKDKRKTENIELYKNFILNLKLDNNNIKSDNFLIKLFHELNEEYFYNSLKEPKMIFGNENYTKLGSYEEKKDLIKISIGLLEEREFVKYVLYHELLHKKHKSTIKNGRIYSHTKAFKLDEAKFHDKNIEKKLQLFLKNKKRNYKKRKKFTWF